MRGLVFALLGHAALSACSIDVSANPGTRCDEVTSCALQKVCYRGFCVNRHDVPAIELDAALAPATGSDAVAPGTNASNLEAGASAPNPPPLEAGAPPAVVPSATSAGDAGEPGTAVTPPVDAGASPPASTPPVTIPPADPSTPTQPVTPPVTAPTTPPVVTPPTEPVTPPSTPNVPAEPPAQTPTTPPAMDPPDDTETDSPLMLCLPLCSTRSVLCLVCLSGSLGSAEDNCDERRRRANPNVREMCDFLCSTFRCER